METNPAGPRNRRRPRRCRQCPGCRMSARGGAEPGIKLVEQADARLTGPADGLEARGPTSRCLTRSTALSDSHSGLGRVAEWFKAPVLKTGVPARVPWVRIPPLPPRYY